MGAHPHFIGHSTSISTRPATPRQQQFLQKFSRGEAARKNYIEFLKSGSSNDPVELLKIAGVDMSSPEPIRMAMETFKGLVEELEQLMQA